MPASFKVIDRFPGMENYVVCDGAVETYEQAKARAIKWLRHRLNYSTDEGSAGLAVVIIRKEVSHVR